MADPSRPIVLKSLGAQFLIHRFQQLRVVANRRMRVEQVERTGVADRHQRQALAFRERQDADIERVEAQWINRAQFARAGAGCGLDRDEIEPELLRNAVGRDIELRAGAAGRAAGIVGEFHDGPPAPLRIRFAGPAAGVLKPSNVRNGLILPRVSSRNSLGRTASARSPWTRRMSSPGSMRARRATTARNASGCCAICGTSCAVFAFKGSMTPLTIGMCAGHTSSHL